MNNKIAKLLADILPARVVYWILIRAFAHTTTHECSHKTPDETGFSDLMDSWEKLVGKKV